MKFSKYLWGIVFLSVLIFGCGKKSDKNGGQGEQGEQGKQDKQESEQSSIEESELQKKRLVYTVPSFGRKDVTEFDNLNGMDLGVGYDSVTETIKGDCVQRKEATPIVGLRGQKLTFNLKKVENINSFLKEIEVSAAASFKAGLGKIKGKAEFANSIHINDYSIYLIASINVINETKRMRDVELTDSALEKLQLKGREAFRERCGDEFVVGYTSGGQFLAVLEIKTNSSEERSQILLGLSGNFGSMNSSGDFKKKIVEVSKTKGLEVYLYQEGGETSEIKITPEELIIRALQFPEAVAGEKAVPYLATTLSYSTLNLPDTMGPIDVSHQKDVLEKMSEDRARSLHLMANIDYIRSHQEEFIDVNMDELNQVSQQLRHQLNKIMLAARKCFSDYRKCEYPEDLDFPPIALPKRIESNEYLCKKPLYIEKNDPLCGVKNYNKGRAAICGAERFLEGSGLECGIREFKAQRTEFCGVELYKLDKSEYCPRQGPIKDYVPTENGCEAFGFTPVITRELPGLTVYSNRTIDIDSLDRVVNMTAANYVNCTASEGDFILCYNKWLGIRTILCKEIAPCRHPAHGVELYRECPHPNHGINYASCRHEKFGVESYKECENDTFGVREYKTCRLPNFGIERCLDFDS